MFSGRKLIIATKHQKEKAIAPLFEKELGIICITDERLDTDVLGTFTGEIERKQDPISTAREKCFLAMNLSGCDMAVASEGSFGAHPSAFFITADDEFIMFIDKKNNLEIIARELSMETNFHGEEIYNLQQLLDFSRKVQFPSHGIILRNSKNDNDIIIKGITNYALLEESYHKLTEGRTSIFAETDMRAMYNPTRMGVIEQAAQKLIQKIKSCCPACNMPGFGVTDAKKGLRCNLCNSPTNSILYYIYSCSHCSFVKEEMFPNGKTTEDPMYCDHCNP